MIHNADANPIGTEEPRTFGELSGNVSHSTLVRDMKYDTVRLSQVFEALRTLHLHDVYAHCQDYVIGAGLAFDPLPSTDWTCVLDDRAALAADLSQLVRDCNVVVHHYDGFVSTPTIKTGAGVRVNAKSTHGKASPTREKAG